MGAAVTQPDIIENQTVGSVENQTVGSDGGLIERGLRATTYTDLSPMTRGKRWLDGARPDNPNLTPEFFDPKPVAPTWRERLVESARRVELKGPQKGLPQLKLPVMSGNLVDEVIKLTGYSRQRLEDLVGVSRQSLTEWEKLGKKLKDKAPRENTEHALAALEALRYAGLAFYPLGGRESVQSWLEYPKSVGKPIDCLLLPEGPRTLMRFVDQSIYY